MPTPGGPAVSGPGGAGCWPGASRDLRSCLPAGAYPGTTRDRGNAAPCGLSLNARGRTRARSCPWKARLEPVRGLRPGGARAPPSGGLVADRVGNSRSTWRWRKRWPCGAGDRMMRGSDGDGWTEEAGAADPPDPRAPGFGPATDCRRLPRNAAGQSDVCRRERRRPKSPDPREPWPEETWPEETWPESDLARERPGLATRRE